MRVVGTRESKVGRRKESGGREEVGLKSAEEEEAQLPLLTHLHTLAPL